MSRPLKHDWKALYEEYTAGDYKTVTCFAEIKGIHPVAVQREFRKIRDRQNKTKPPETTKQNTFTQQNKTEPPKPSPDQCEAIGHKSGDRCLHKALPGQRFCGIHLDGRPGQCIAKSRQTGERCKKKAEPGKTRCKFHGGRNTGPPPGTQSALKHGLFARFLPEELRPALEQASNQEAEKIIRETIAGLVVAIARAQEVMHVHGPGDDTKELVEQADFDNGSKEKWELYYARDKYANYLQAISKAGNTLSNLVRLLSEIKDSDDDGGSLGDLVKALQESRQVSSSGV